MQYSILVLIFLIPFLKPTFLENCSRDYQYTGDAFV